MTSDIVTCVLFLFCVVGVVTAAVIVPLALFDSLERFGDELRDYWEGDE